MNIWLKMLTLIFQLTETTRKTAFETLQAVEPAAVTASACLYLVQAKGFTYLNLTTKKITDFGVQLICGHSLLSL